MKKIVLISVGQPSTNPRLVKEANTLADAGLDVYVIYSYWTSWAWEADKLLLQNVKWKPILAGGSPYQHRLKYFFTRFRQRLFILLAKHFTFKFGIAEIAKGRAYPEMLKKAIAIKADLYIAHILAALPVAVNASQKNNARCGFDAEDFHRMEVGDDTSSFNFKISKHLEDKYLPQVDYLTAASPLIAAAYKKHYPALYVTVINNVFESNYNLKIPVNSGQKLRLFWFSQTVGPNRGLENLIQALMLLKDDSFELHLLGNADEDTRQGYTIYFKDKPGTIHFHNPILPASIIEFASQFDIGIASEQGTPFNRDICLTNKIFTYIQSGLAVVASDTSAQTALLKQYPSIGKLYQKDDPQSLADVLLNYQQHREELFETRQAALKIAHLELNWEMESEQFLNVVKETLNKS